MRGEGPGRRGRFWGGQGVGRSFDREGGRCGEQEGVLVLGREKGEQRERESSNLGPSASSLGPASPSSSRTSIKLSSSSFGRLL